MFMFIKTILGLLSPVGSLRCEGRHREVLSRMLSKCLWRFQNSPLRSLSWSSTSGRCRWTRFRPKRAAIKTTPPYADKPEAPDGLKASASVCVCSGLLFSNASSDAGRLVRISFSSTVIGHPVPILA